MKQNRFHVTVIVILFRYLKTKQCAENINLGQSRELNVVGLCLFALPNKTMQFAA